MLHHNFRCLRNYFLKSGALTINRSNFVEGKVGLLVVGETQQPFGKSIILSGSLILAHKMSS